MQQYLDVLQKILDEGVEKESGRANMPNTIGISKADISMDLSKGFPLLTTKKMYFKGIIHELLWFLRGETNIKYLVDNNVNIWNSDAYRWYLKYTESLEESDYDYLMDDPNQNKTRQFTLEEFIDNIKADRVGTDVEYRLGDLGKVYGYQWRNQNGVDQIKDVLDGLKNNPYSRYHIIDGYNKADFPEMALPPCHLLYQFIVRPLSTAERWDLIEHIDKYNFKRSGTNKEIHELYDEYNVPRFYLDLNMYQRSVDSALGLSFNLTSMSLLLTLISKASNMVAGVANWIGGDTHIYLNHIEGVKEQLLREPMKLPTLDIDKELNSLDDILNLTIDDFEIINYNSHPKINFELFVGLKKK
ncbi:MAG: thymidylate synthase [Bacteroidales bacterium]|jgi:thymidylate synthase|nr:thymidylate synthase [Bacteroidales bacterium]